MYNKQGDKMKLDKQVKHVAVGLMVFGAVLVVSQMSGCTKAGPAGAAGETGASVVGGVGPAGPQGPVGPSGSPGLAGNDGHNALFGTPAPAPSSTCPSSGNSGTINNPSYGQVFTMGVDTNDNGVLDDTEVQQVAVVCNGSDGSQGVPGDVGAQGPAGVSPLYSPVGIIQPCGAASSQYKEALLGLTGGFILSEFSGSSDGLTVRNTLLPDGSYEDTDSSGCTFTISTASDGDRTVSWNGGEASYSAATESWTTPTVSSN